MDHRHPDTTAVIILVSAKYRNLTCDSLIPGIKPSNQPMSGAAEGVEGPSVLTSLIEIMLNFMAALPFRAAGSAMMYDVFEVGSR